MEGSNAGSPRIATKGACGLHTVVSVVKNSFLAQKILLDTHIYLRHTLLTLPILSSNIISADC